MVYAVLVVSALLFEFPLNMPVGSLPLALSDDGTPKSLVALVMGAGLFAAVVFSVPLGGLVDRFGRLATMRAAALLGLASMVGLGVTHGDAWGATLMGTRSIALALFMTAEFAYAAEIASEARAVSGVATLGMIGNLAFASAPALAVGAWGMGIGRVQYVWAAGVAAFALLATFFLPAHHDVRGMRSARRFDVRAAWLPACAFAFAGSLQGGVNVALAVLVFQERGIANGAAIFTASAATTFALRYAAGRLVDRYGPRAVSAPTAVIQALGCGLAAIAHSLVAVVVAGVLLGIAWAAVVPVAIGLLFAQSTSESRGSAMGAYNLAYYGGSAVGAVLAAGATWLGPGYALAIVVAGLFSLAIVPYVRRAPAIVAPHELRVRDA